ncbi:FAD-dependent monooxygenase [Deinococcus radiophilus]|uniref:Monooxygenase n=1 Tax=Deinococcus radiophilus TaxID=32062 RepID=A0A3S0I537_9DEIO|nr:FAD-dependent monooxygenase [Deinococcus radiophilus]RTR25346.1 monooxygenase [Deinococcus radiophilus]UFA50492.1 FAD-dependent monooxygenase [Deinococcus radiophilus]
MQLSHQKIVIVGGGVSGLALAHALQRYGVSSRVYEAAPSLTHLGGGLIMAPNSVQVLEELGLDAVLRVHAVPLEQMVIFDVSGRELYRRSQQEVAHRFGGRGLMGLPRAELHRTLAEHLPAGTVQTGHRLTALDNDFQSVTAHFSQGQRVTGDLLVAADGRDSRVRELLYPETQLVRTGDVAYRGITTLEPSGPLRRAFAEYWGAGRRFTFFRMSQTHTYWHAPVQQRATDPELGHAELLHEFRDFPAQVQGLIESTAAADISALPLRDLSPLPQWWNRRTVLVGDAAHATSPNLGQGAAQAMEDVAALAERLAKDPDRVSALQNYQRIREATANAAVANARAFGELGRRGGLGRLVRNAALSINPDLARRRIEAFYGEHHH